MWWCAESVRDTLDIGREMKSIHVVCMRVRLLICLNSLTLRVVYPSCTHGYLPMGIPKNMGIYPYPNTHESTVWVDTHTQIPNGIHGLGICVLGLNLPLV